MNSLYAENMSKSFQNRAVLTNVQLELSGGHVYAFTGKNGSGKTMLFRILSGLVYPDEGTVLLNGINIHQAKERNINLGIVIEHAGLYPNLNAYENLKLLARLNNRIGKKEIIHSIQRVGLNPNEKLPYKKYSLGMKQRLLLAQAIMEQPDFLFLDEPTNAIDADGVTMFYKIIQEEKERGAVILIASHISEDLSNISAERYLVENARVMEVSDYENK